MTAEFSLNNFISIRTTQNISSRAENGKILKLFSGLLPLVSTLFFSC